jgi:hypothetical protein
MSYDDINDEIYDEIYDDVNESTSYEYEINDDIMGCDICLDEDIQNVKTECGCATKYCNVCIKFMYNKCCVCKKTLIKIIEDDKNYFNHIEPYMPAGPVGVTGAIGPMGVAGATGVTGAVGPVGAVGLVGYGGGLAQLVAYGAMDIYLTGNPNISFFKTTYNKHTSFATDNINSYSFALDPVSHQPSGTCNYSKIDDSKNRCNYSNKHSKICNKR